jgi:hypothetical protein
VKIWILGFALFPLLLFGGPLAAMVLGLVDLDNDWRTASQASAGIAPDPATTPEAVIQVYGARAFGWRGAFAVHTWVAVKRRDAPSFMVYEVVGWHQRHGGRILTSGQGIPDRLWYGAAPEVYADLRGPEAEALIDRVEAAIRAYPHQDLYRTWPGPNSNTFTAHVARAVPELGVDLPPTAIGKDYLGPATFAAPSPSGSGYQVSLFGLLGVMAAAEEGIELNLLGLTFGVDPLDLAIKLPGLGRLPRTGADHGLAQGPAS